MTLHLEMKHNLKQEKPSKNQIILFCTIGLQNAGHFYSNTLMKGKSLLISTVLYFTVLELPRSM